MVYFEIAVWFAQYNLRTLIIQVLTVLDVFFGQFSWFPILPTMPSDYSLKIAVA